MTKERTVDQIATGAVRAMPVLGMKLVEKRQMREVLYTLSEAGRVSAMDDEEWELVIRTYLLVKAGKYTEDMRL